MFVEAGDQGHPLDDDAIKRFGSALNLNVHLHMLILDGVYTLEQNGPQFYRVAFARRAEPRVSAQSARCAHSAQPHSRRPHRRRPRTTLARPGTHRHAGSAECCIDPLPHRRRTGAGRRTLTLKNPALARADSPPKPFTANRDGFSLNTAPDGQTSAALAVQLRGAVPTVNLRVDVHREPIGELRSLV